ncbi:HAD family hydrolase [Microbacterium murale]|uniref:Hydrolase of the HAD superfamily n=1 Tax=Microbacterium murale TaxID=1081040 RepID=A0ABU0PCD3_9MICO|nr:HAD family hydrolase [Microbacterium murale]MDQ0644572.1 putative hydrolase of the HAD superfamily [Microbacterium murale]
MGDRVYVFDLDDTLYLERDYVRSGFMHIGDVSRDRYGIDGIGEHAWSLFERGTRGNTFDLVAAHFALPTDATRVFIEEYRNHDPAIELQPDALSYLQNLPDDAVGTGVITDGHAEGQWRKLHALGIDDVLDNIVVTGEHGQGWTKPSENAFRLIESRFPGPGIEFVYFGDNPMKDFNAPHQLGWRTVRVRRPLGLHYVVDDAVVVDETISAFPTTGATARHAAGNQPRREKGTLPQ